MQDTPFELTGGSQSTGPDKNEIWTYEATGHQIIYKNKQSLVYFNFITVVDPDTGNKKTFS